MIVNDVDQWGGGQVWHPRLEPDQISRIAFFADGKLLSAARADLKNSYPPEARIEVVSRCLLHVKPDLFLLFDRVETAGKGKVEWRFHAAFVEPQGRAARYTAFGFDPTASNPMRDRSKTYDEAFQKRADVSCQVALLTPGVQATVGMTGTYFRWSPFSRPQRHLRVVQEGESPLTLFTAFAPKVAVEIKDNTYRGKQGHVSWVAVVGAGAGGELESDGHFAIAVEEQETGRAEVFRFGGRRLSLRGVEVRSSAGDVFAEIEDGKVARTVETLPIEQSAGRPAKNRCCRNPRLRGY
jgi:hypothetical protein